MITPLKTDGLNIDVYAQSADRKHPVGMLYVSQQGKKYRYARAGSSNLSAGVNTVSPSGDSDVLDEACASAHAIGETKITETITSTTIAEDYFVGGHFIVNDGTGQGHSYEILASTAVTAGTEITVTLATPIKVALVATTTQFSLIASLWQGTYVYAQADAATGCLLPATGAPLIDVTATYYYWSQTGGDGVALSGSSAAVGESLMLCNVTSGVAGSTLVLTEAASVIATRIGKVIAVANVDTEYNAIQYMID